MSCRTFSTVLPFLAVMAWASASPAATIVITDKTTWESEVLSRTHAFNTEHFDDATLNPELTTRTSAGGVRELDIGAGEDNGVWWDRVAKPTESGIQLTTTFEISGGSYAIGGNWNLLPAGHGSHIQITLLDAAGLAIASNEIPYLQGEFWGILSDDPFTSMRLTSHGENGRTQETYYLDDMVYSRGLPTITTLNAGKTTPVPLPSAFWLFTSSLLGLIGVGRWRGDALPATTTTARPRP